MNYGIYTKNRERAEKLVEAIKKKAENSGEKIIEEISIKDKIYLELDNDIKYLWEKALFSPHIAGYRFDGVYIDMELNYSDLEIICPFILDAKKEDIHIFNNKRNKPYKIAELRDKLKMLQAFYGDLYVNFFGHNGYSGIYEIDINLDYDFGNEFNENLVDSNLGSKDDPVKMMYTVVFSD